MLNSSENDATDLVFLWQQESEYGFFVTGQNFEFMLKFYAARDNATTWSDFISRFNVSETEFISVFNQCDEIQPQGNDLLSDIGYDVFVLQDSEFPAPQFAADTYSRIGEVLTDYPCDTQNIMTEFGMPIEMYPVPEFVKLKDLLEQAGYRVDSKPAPLSLCLYDYGH